MPQGPTPLTCSIAYLEAGISVTHTLSDLERAYWERRIGATLLGDGPDKDDNDGETDDEEEPITLAGMADNVQNCPIVSVYPIGGDSEWTVFLEVETDEGTIWVKDRVTGDTLSGVREALLFQLWDSAYSTPDALLGTSVLVTGIRDVRDAPRHEYVEVIVGAGRIGTGRQTRALPARTKCPAEVRYARNDDRHSDQRREFVRRLGRWSHYAMYEGPVPLVIESVTPVTDTSAVISAEGYASHIRLRWLLSFSVDETEEDNGDTAVTPTPNTDRFLDSLGCGQFSNLRGKQVYVAPVAHHAEPFFTGLDAERWGVYLSPSADGVSQSSSRSARLARRVRQSSLVPF